MAKIANKIIHRSISANFDMERKSFCQLPFVPQFSMFQFRIKIQVPPQNSMTKETSLVSSIH